MQAVVWVCVWPFRPSDSIATAAGAFVPAVIAKPFPACFFPCRSATPAAGCLWAQGSETTHTRLRLQNPHFALRHLPLISCQLFQLCHGTCVKLFPCERSNRSEIRAENELAGTWVGANPHWKGKLGGHMAANYPAGMQSPYGAALMCLWIDTGLELRCEYWRVSFIVFPMR